MRAHCLDLAACRQPCADLIMAMAAATSGALSERSEFKVARLSVRKIWVTITETGPIWSAKNDEMQSSGLLKSAARVLVEQVRQIRSFSHVRGCAYASLHLAA